jgi:4-azaleucine resistance transporter AzlC
MAASSTPITSPQSEFWAGCRAIVPLVVGAIPFGLIFGTLSANSGLSFAAALAMSAFVFAGSAQFIALGLLAAGTALPLVILTTFVVNLRHLLYAVSLIDLIGNKVLGVRNSFLARQSRAKKLFPIKFNSLCAAITPKVETADRILVD